MRETIVSPGQAANTLIGHGFTQGCIAGVMDRATLHGRASVRWHSIGKEATVVCHGADVELIVTRTIVMHRDVVDDFEYFRPGDRLIWHHGPTNQRQNGTIIAWVPEYLTNAVGNIVCIKARAIIQVDHLVLGMAESKQDVQLTETFHRYGSGIVMVYR